MQSLKSESSICTDKNNTEEDQKLVQYIDQTWIDTSYTAKQCWYHEEECGEKELVSRGQQLIIVLKDGEFGFVQNALLIYKDKSCTGDNSHEINGDNF